MQKKKDVSGNERLWSSLYFRVGVCVMLNDWQACSNKKFHNARLFSLEKFKIKGMIGSQSFLGNNFMIQNLKVVFNMITPSTKPKLQNRIE